MKKTQTEHRDHATEARMLRGLMSGFPLTRVSELRALIEKIALKDAPAAEPHYFWLGEGGNNAQI